MKRESKQRLKRYKRELSRFQSSSSSDKKINVKGSLVTFKGHSFSTNSNFTSLVNPEGINQVCDF